MISSKHTSRRSMILGGLLFVLAGVSKPAAKKAKKARADSSPDHSSARTNAKTNISRGFAKSFSQENSFGKTESAFRPATCPNTWRAEPRKKNILSFFKRNFTPAKSEMQGVFFFRGCRGSARRWRGDCSSVRFRSEPRALRAYDIICFENRCAGEDLHLHVLADTSPSSWPVF